MSLLKQPKLKGYLEFKNITFGYDHTASPLVEAFSLSLKPGQQVALVGGSGSGKSTIAKLVAGLHRSWAGEIYFDGQPRSQISRQVLSTSISFIEHDILLFAGTVRDNLTLWDTTIPEQDLIQACRDVGLHETILSLPEGYNTNLLEGAAHFSAAQRQCLEIARGLVRNPSILLMDEATSVLDAESEKMIEHTVRLRGCTCLMMARHFSTVRNCDEVIVFEHGKIVRRGTYHELRQSDGIVQLMDSSR
jgi:ATP-binding cassette, subfamily C, bacterial